MPQEESSIFGCRAGQKPGPAFGVARITAAPYLSPIAGSPSRPGAADEAE
jgi:hypothetical protein